MTKAAQTKNINIPVDEVLHHKVKVKLAQQKKQLNVLIPELLEIWVSEKTSSVPVSSPAAQRELSEISLDKRVRNLLEESLDKNVFDGLRARRYQRRLSWRDALALAIAAWVNPRKPRTLLNKR